MLRILLADDHDVVRRGLRELLEDQDDWQVCAEAADGSQAVDLAIEHRPDIAVLDLSMPGLNSLEAVRIIRRQLPQTEVLIFTMHDTEQLVREVLAAGARGYVLKSDAASELIDAIASLAQHKAFFTSTISASLLNALLDPPTGNGDDPAKVNALTPREVQIVQMLALGKSNREIASSLSISTKTVETHRATIMRKLGLSSIVELVHYAARNRLIEL